MFLYYRTTFVRVTTYLLEAVHEWYLARVGRPGYGQSPVFFLTVPCLSAHLSACLHSPPPESTTTKHLAVVSSISLTLVSIVAASALTVTPFYILNPPTRTYYA